jgi:hypothetical protein
MYCLLALQVHHLRPELLSLNTEVRYGIDAYEAVLLITWFGRILLGTVLALASSLLEWSKPLLTVLGSSVLVDIAQARAGVGATRALEALVSVLSGDVVLEEVIALMG